MIHPSLLHAPPVFVLLQGFPFFFFLDITTIVKELSHNSTMYQGKNKIRFLKFPYIVLRC